MPLRWKPWLGDRTGRAERLLDPCSAGYATDLGVRDAGVLADLTEQVLYVDEVQSSAEQSAKGEPEVVEPILLFVGHLSDDVIGAAKVYARKDL
jgi:hypothetical protein